MSAPIYLDHAATSSPKPACVAERLHRYFAEEALSAGRGGYQRALGIGQEISAARAALATLIGAESPDRIVFTRGGTESLNLAILGLLQSGDHVIVTDFEHNSVLRPLSWLQKTKGIEITSISPTSTGQIDPSHFTHAFREKTRLICLVHASNVTGAILPVQEICLAARQRGIISLVDAAQSVGHFPVDVSEISCDLLAAPAHKGLLAPLGTGFLYLRKGLETQVAPLIFGGTGTNSEQSQQPEKLPEKYESGSLNVPGLLGLAAALSVVTPEFVTAQQQHQQQLTSQFLQQLSGVPQIIIHSPDIPVSHRTGLVSLTLSGQDPRVVEMILDSHFGIETRSGFHCAPNIHAHLGTADSGGTIRFSFGHSTTPAEILKAASALTQIAGSSATQ